MKLLRAGWVLPVAGGAVRDGAVAVADGRIAWVGPWRSPERPAGELLDLGPGVLLPGLVNAHCHVELSYLAGALSGRAGFSAWVAGLVERRAAETREEVRAAAAAALQALAAAGTVAVGDVSNRLEHLDLFEAAGLRAVVFHELLGWDPARAGEIAHAADERLADLPARTGVSVRLAAHAPHSVSPPLFAALQARGGPACVHLAESPDEARFLCSGDGPWREFLARRVGPVPFEAPGLSPVRYLESLGVLRRGLLAVHGVQAGRDDCRLLAERGVRVALCPRSNLALGVGLPPVEALLEAGVELCLGSDSLASAPGLDVLDDLRLLRREFPAVPVHHLVEMATRNGALALGLDDLGTLEPGRRAALAFLPSERELEDAAAFVADSEARARRVEA